ncbi:PAN-4 multi-domain protein [Teratosphaeria destructans]|uniref:PAN-4 multi-domain protein n=1 Tax=Teratosphaeria destructans TaxID=418781 RepID=A0A9W7SXF2_9PEZI|nr:PAN-4 multi-domain protein [Teratosphaeria destructans]
MYGLGMLLTQVVAVSATAAAITTSAKTTSSTKAASTSSKAPAGADGIHGATFGTTDVCPQANNTVYTAASKSQYWLLCGADTTDQPLSGTWASYPGSFDACMAECDAQAGCASVFFNTVCYLKGTPQQYIYRTDVQSRIAVKIPQLQWVS